MYSYINVCASFYFESRFDKIMNIGNLGYLSQIPARASS